MGESGKRTRRDGDNEGKNQKQRTSNNENSGGGELVIYRIVCPHSVIGSVIGKGGKVINSLRQDTHAKIKVVDEFPNTNKRVILIYCYVNDKDSKNYDPMEAEEDGMETLCPAQDALLRVHSVIVNARSNKEDSDEKRKEEAEILVPTSQAANIIGKSGSVIKQLRAKTSANIKVDKKDPTDASHNCAMNFDNFVMITGDGEAVKRALFAVSAIMYKFSPKEEIPLDPSVTGPQTTIIIPSDVPIYPGGNFYPSVEPTGLPYMSVPQVVGTQSNAPELHGVTEVASEWPYYPSAHPVVPSRSEELVVRVLCPSDKIGRVIGKGGSAIKSIRKASGSRIEVDDKKDDSEECVVTVTSTESTNDVKSAASEAVLLLQQKINDEDDETVYIRLLVPSKVIGCLIGKSGSIISEMRKGTKAVIYISKGEKPKCASSNDELVEVSGKIDNVRDALVQIIGRLRGDALKDKDGGQNAPTDEPMYPGSLSLPPLVSSVGMPPVAPFGYEQRAETGSSLGMLTGGGLYGYNSLQATHAGDNGYGALSSYSSNTYGGLSLFTEVVIPSYAVAKVMGKGGSNLDNFRKISGATIDIIDSKTSRAERIAQISGTPEQKRMAESLIQAFIMSN